MQALGNTIVCTEHHRRTVTGFRLKKVATIIGSTRKTRWISFRGMKDVFVNIAGGLKIEDPSIDMAVLCALLSSYEDVPLPMNICFSGEIGLSGEIRAVNRIEQRIAEAEKLGFEKMIVSKYNQKSLHKKSFQIEIIAVAKVEELYQLLF